MLLNMLHPEVAGRSCENCQKYIHDASGVMRRHAETGKPVPRPSGAGLACHAKDGCPMGTPDSRRDLSDKNRIAWHHYQECAAVGRFPIDGIVEQNAGLIRSAEQIAARTRAWEQLQATKSTNEMLLAVLKAR